MSDGCCPHCHTRSGISSYISLILTFDNLPAVLLYGLIVLAYSDRLALGSWTAAGFIMLLALPLSLRAAKKFSCGNCGAEFRAQNAPAVLAEKLEL